jgi:hypothetical protein
MGRSRIGLQDGDKVYVIKKELLARWSEAIPMNAKEQLGYCKKHADQVIDSDPNVEW